MAATKRKSREFRFTDRDFEYIATLLKRRTGIALGDCKMDMAYARLAGRIRQLGMTSFESYINYLEGPDGEDEVGHLVNSLTTNLTRFFREKHHFEHLAKVSVPESLRLIKAGERNRLRIWTAGCSTGEEAYSIAMVLRDCVSGMKKMDARILATDLDTIVLDKAARGVYPAEPALKLPAQERARHFESLGDPATDDWKVRPDLRQLVVFNQLNLLGPWPMTNLFDVIFCRNVMIYFDRDTTRALLARLADQLRPGGWLYVGHSENVGHYTDRFVRAGITIYNKQGEA